jgi:hypothetical protein
MPHPCNNPEHGKKKEKLVEKKYISGDKTVGMTSTAVVFCLECGDPEPWDEEEILDAHLKQQK